MTTNGSADISPEVRMTSISPDREYYSTGICTMHGSYTGPGCPVCTSTPGVHGLAAPKPKAGWLCPACGQGCAPWIPYCDCVKKAKA